MAMPQKGRGAGCTMGPHSRQKIADSKILKRLIDCAEGTIEMTSTEVTVGLALLKKVMPDLSTVELKTPEDGDGNPTALLVQLVAPRNQG